MTTFPTYTEQRLTTFPTQSYVRWERTVLIQKKKKESLRHGGNRKRISVPCFARQAAPAVRLLGFSLVYRMNRECNHESI